MPTRDSVIPFAPAPTPHMPISLTARVKQFCNSLIRPPASLKKTAETRSN
jgi:hypothetical protein